MKNKINSFYFSKKTFLISAVVACVGFAAWAGYNAYAGILSQFICSCIFLALTILLLVAYRKGETNIQKTLMGSLLTFMFMDYLAVFVRYLGKLSTGDYTAATIVTAIKLTLIVVIFIFHMRQQLDHTGESAGTVVNQCSGLLVVVTLLFEIYKIATNYITVSGIIWTISISVLTIFLIAMETRIKEYKKIRAEKKANGKWNETERQKAKEIFKF